MHEVSARGILAGQRHYVVLNACTERAGTEGEAIVRIVNSREEPLYVFVGVYYARQTKHGNWRVVGVYAHVYATLVAYWHDGFEEVFHVGPELVFVYALV